MRRFFFILWWSLLLSSGIVALLEYLHPATFAKSVFPLLLAIAFVSLFFAILNKRYE